MSSYQIKLTTRMRDTAFKRVLKNLPFGTEITVDWPYGGMTLPNNAASAATLTKTCW